jgi:heme exporter protein A
VDTAAFTKETRPSQDGTALSLRDVAVERSGRRIVGGVTFDLNAGDAIILRGPNGSGKTTLLRAIAGLMPIETGSIEVRIDGAANRTQAALRTVTTLCAHADAIKLQLSIRENLAFWLRLYGGERALIDAALEAFELSTLADFRAAVLSAGQRRRLSLSRLIIAKTPIWLLDEPTASMDADSCARFEFAIARHLQGGGAAIVATHDKVAIDDARTFVLGAGARA